MTTWGVYVTLPLTPYSAGEAGRDTLSPFLTQSAKNMEYIRVTVAASIGAFVPLASNPGDATALNSLANIN